MEPARVSPSERGQQPGTERAWITKGTPPPSRSISSPDAEPALQTEPGEDTTGEDVEKQGRPSPNGIGNTDQAEADDTTSAHAPEEVAAQKKTIQFPVECYPPWYITLMYAFQQMLANLSGPMGVVYIIHGTICSAGNDVLFAELLSVAIFMNGLCTFLQVSFGVRLPILQGSSMAFVAPIVAMMGTSSWKCPETAVANSTISPNTTLSGATGMEEEPWQPRLREISGGLIVASFTQVILGCSGVMGLLMNYIGPLTICPTVALIGLSLFTSATNACQHQWGIAMLTNALIIFFSVFVGGINVPLPGYSKEKGCKSNRFPIFRLFPHIFAIGICWALSYILTITDVFPSDPKALGYLARTDARLDAITKAKWFFIAYPGMWGTPTFGAGIFVGMFAATIASIIESVGDYYATARICGVPAPPKHAVNRGIAMEGFGSILSGMLYSAHGTTSFSNTIGFIGITGMASRFVWQLLGIMMIVCGAIGKFGAALSIVPDPIIGGMMITSLGMVISVGMSNLQFVDLESPRNLLILGVSFMLGMMLPFWIRDNPAIINTGNNAADQALTVFLSSGMFVGGVVGFILDNITPGTAEERGIKAMMAHIGMCDVDADADADDVTEAKIRQVYDIPFISNAVRRVKCCSYIPFMPSYFYRPAKRCCRRNERKESYSLRERDSTEVQTRV